MGPYDVSDPSLTEKKTSTKSVSSIQGHRGISSDTSIRHERDAFVDYFDKNGKEAEKNNWRSSVSCKSGR